MARGIRVGMGSATTTTLGSDRGTSWSPANATFNGARRTSARLPGSRNCRSACPLAAAWTALGEPALPVGRARADRIRLVGRAFPRVARPRSIVCVSIIFAGSKRRGRGREAPRRRSTGQWVKGPGAALFRAVQAALSADRLPFVAENLARSRPRSKRSASSSASRAWPFCRSRSLRILRCPISSTQLPSKSCRLHGDTRQRHDGRVVDRRCRPQHAVERGACRGTGVRVPVSSDRRSSNPLGVRQGCARVRRRHRDCPGAGPAGPWERGRA